MKKLTLALVLMCSLVSCEKENLEPMDLQGKWTWLLSSGGIAGIRIKATKEDFQTVTFTANNMYELYKNGQKVKSLSYILVKDKSIFSSDAQYIIKFENDVLLPMSYQIQKDTLTLFLTLTPKTVKSLIMSELHFQSALYKGLFWGIF